MRLADVPQVMEVERESFPSMWPPTAFKRELQQNRLARYIVVVEHNPHARFAAAEPDEGEHQAGPLTRLFDEVRHIFGAGDDDALPAPQDRAELVAAFLGVWMLPDEAHIVTVAVRESHRRRGMGELLLISAIELARERGQGLITLECRVTNHAALAMYEKYGFQQVGLRPRYYSDNREDAYLLTVSSLLTDEYREEFERLKGEHHRRWGDFDVDIA